MQVDSKNYELRSVKFHIYVCNYICWFAVADQVRLINVTATAVLNFKNCTARMIYAVSYVILCSLAIFCSPWLICFTNGAFLWFFATMYSNSHANIQNDCRPLTQPYAKQPKCTSFLKWMKYWIWKESIGITINL